jgi:hypothetical protein
MAAKKPTDDDWLKDNEEVKDHMSNIWGLCEGEGLEEAFKEWKALPKYRQTKTELDHICKGIATIDIDPYDIPDWLPNI